MTCREFMNALKILKCSSKHLVFIVNYNNTKIVVIKNDNGNDNNNDNDNELLI